MTIGRVCWGSVLICLGVLFLLERAGLISAGSAIAIWSAVVFIGLGAIQLIANPRRSFAPLVIMSIGVVLLLSTFDLFSVSVWAMVWPFVLIVLGARMLLRGRPWAHDTERGEESVDALALFSGREIGCASPAFRGGSLTALFGGIKLDLRSAALHDDGAKMDVITVFGGASIKRAPAVQAMRAA